MLAHLKILPRLLLAVLVLAADCLSQQSSVSTPTADRYLNILAALGKKDYGRAIADSKALIVDEPSFPLVYEKLVNAAQRGGDLEQAQMFFTSQLISPNTNLRARFGLGLIERVRGDQAGAIEQYRQCLQRLPDFVPAYIALVDTYRAFDRLPEVEPFIETLAQTTPSRYGLSYLRYKQGRFQEAIELSEQVLLLDPHLFEAYKTRAQSLYALGRYAEAREAAQTLLRKVTEPEQVELRLSGLIIGGIAAEVNGNRADALADLTAAYRGVVEVGNLELEESVHGQLAYVYHHQNDCGQSLQHNLAALALGNELRSPYVGRYNGNIGAA